MAWWIWVINLINFIFFLCVIMITSESDSQCLLPSISRTWKLIPCQPVAIHHCDLGKWSTERGILIWMQQIKSNNEVNAQVVVRKKWVVSNDILHTLNSETHCCNMVAKKETANVLMYQLTHLQRHESHKNTLRTYLYFSYLYVKSTIEMTHSQTHCPSSTNFDAWAHVVE